MIRKSVVAATAAAGVMLVAGCSSSNDAPTKASARPSASASKSARSVAPKPPAVPTLAVGQTVPVRQVGDGMMVSGKSTYRVTLVGVKAAMKVTDPADDYVAHAEKGKVIVCVELKVKLLSGKADTYPYGNPSFEGGDGRAADAELATGVSCKGLGLADDDLDGEPDPHVGQYIDGTDALEVPAGAGDLLFADRSGASLFRVRVPAV